MAKRKVEWYCCNLLSAGMFDPGGDMECDTYFETWVDGDVWENGQASAICPRCHETLWQIDDAAELVEED